MSLLHADLSQIIIDSFFKVHKELGFGFLERVYENALMIELQKADVFCEKQKAIKVFYDGKTVGDYFADIIVEEKIILELKACPLIEEHEFQLLNYLKATEIEVGMLLSFGKKPRVIRKIFTNDRK